MRHWKNVIFLIKRRRIRNQEEARRKEERKEQVTKQEKEETKKKKQVACGYLFSSLLFYFFCTSFHYYYLLFGFLLSFSSSSSLLFSFSSLFTSLFFCLSLPAHFLLLFPSLLRSASLSYPSPLLKVDRLPALGPHVPVGLIVAAPPPLEDEEFARDQRRGSEKGSKESLVQFSVLSFSLIRFSYPAFTSSFFTISGSFSLQAPFPSLPFSFTPFFLPFLFASFPYYSPVPFLPFHTCSSVVHFSFELSLRRRSPLALNAGTHCSERRRCTYAYKIKSPLRKEEEKKPKRKRKSKTRKKKQGMEEKKSNCFMTSFSVTMTSSQLRTSTGAKSSTSADRLFKMRSA